VILEANLIEDLAKQQAQAGEAHAALEWARAEATPLLQAHALLGVARGILDQGKAPSRK
jgi:hypothetical protein